MDYRVSMIELLWGIIAISHLPRDSKGEDSSNTGTNGYTNLYPFIGCERNAIQLIGGKNKFEGRVEVCQDGQWKTVCNRGWNNVEARVVCRQLGFAEDTRRSELLHRLAFRFQHCLALYCCMAIL